MVQNAESHRLERASEILFSECRGSNASLGIQGHRNIVLGQLSAESNSRLLSSPEHCQKKQHIKVNKEIDLIFPVASTILWRQDKDLLPSEKEFYLQPEKQKQKQNFGCYYCPLSLFTFLTYFLYISDQEIVAFAKPNKNRRNLMQWPYTGTE